MQEEICATHHSDCPRGRCKRAFYRVVEILQLNFRRPINNMDFNRYIDISERSEAKRGLACCYQHGNCIIVPKRSEIVS